MCAHDGAVDHRVFVVRIGRSRISMIDLASWLGSLSVIGPSQCVVSRHQSKQSRPKPPWCNQGPLIEIGCRTERAWSDAAEFGTPCRLALGAGFDPSPEYEPRTGCFPVNIPATIKLTHYGKRHPGVSDPAYHRPRDYCLARAATRSRP